MDLGDLNLHGTRVALRPLASDDAPALAAAAAEARDSYAFTPVPDGLGQAEQYLATALRARDAGERYPFAIVFDQRVVGSTSYYEFTPWTWPPGSPLQRSDRPDALEIGHTWLAASAQRTACNTEAKLLLLGHAFEAWQVHRVALRTDARNQRSRHAMERLGAKFEGVRRADRPASDGTVRDSAYYSIVRAEWPDVRAELLRKLAR